jgi:hypothetical protein
MSGPFQIVTSTAARLATLTPRIEKHGDEDVPAISIGLELTVANSMLDDIDAALRAALYVGDEAQAALPDVEASTPTLRCAVIEKVSLGTKLEGWALQIDDKVDEAQATVFRSCKVDKFVVEPQEGGSILLRLRVGTSDVDAERLGMLGMHVGQNVWLQLRAPDPGGDDAAVAGPDEGRAPQDDATSLFVASQEGAP